MKKILFALMLSSVSACGSDHEVAVDPMSLMPRMPPQSERIAVAEPVATPPVSAPMLVAAQVTPTQFDDALAQGRALAARGERDDAKLMFEAAIKLDKKRPEPHIELSRLYIAEGQRGLAVAAAKQATKRAPLSSQAWNTQGRAQLAAYAYDDAIEAFSRAVELDRDNIWAWNNLGLVELQLKKYDEAVEHLTEATSRKGAPGFMYNNLGIALEQTGKLDDARLAFDAGGKLGSREAASSRKRLEGVKTVALGGAPSPQGASTGSTGSAAPQSKTFENGEGPLIPANAGESSKGTDEGAGTGDGMDDDEDNAVLDAGSAK